VEAYKRYRQQQQSRAAACPSAYSSLSIALIFLTTGSRVQLLMCRNLLAQLSEAFRQAPLGFVFPGFSFQAISPLDKT